MSLPVIIQTLASHARRGAARYGWLTPLLIGLALLSACAGYRLGPTNGVAPRSKSVQVNVFKDETEEPRLIETVTSSLRRQLQQDGTYELDTQNAGDIIVSGRIVRYRRYYLSFEPSDVVTPRDFRLTLTAHVTAKERLSGKVLLDRQVVGHTTIRTTPDLPSVERQALPLVAEDLARNITAMLVDGVW